MLASACWFYLKRFADSAWSAYIMLAALQLKVVWGMWTCRDLTTGDTSSYFLNAYRWFQSGTVNIVWSPLYTAYYGSLLFLTSDAYQATILHRLLIVFASSLLVLAVLRRLLPPMLAWLAAAWWTVLPINFNTLYEVHLFALLPALIAWLVLLSSQGRWARGAGLAVLAASTILVRNEMAVATVLFGLACLVYEWRLRRSSGTAQVAEFRWRATTMAYGVPLGVAFALCAFFYSRSLYKYPGLKPILEAKHTVNMGQVYAFGYQQRHPEWTASPWTGYRELMTSHFGDATLTLSQMMLGNPAAAWEHFAWNWSLAPNGLQVLLFNATSGTVNPDYAPVRTGSWLALALSVLVLACWAAGLFCLIRERRFWWRAWLRPRLMGWAGMLAVAVVAVPVITTQRPRPSYLFSLSVFLMAMTGMCLFVISRRWRWTKQIPRWLPLAVAAVLIAVVPRSFRTASGAAHRPLHDLAQRLQPYEATVTRPGAVAMLGDFCFEVSAYVWKGRYKSLDYLPTLKDLPADARIEPLLDEHNIDLLYLNERILLTLEHERPVLGRALLSGDAPEGWRMLGSGDAPADRWRLYQRAIR